MKKSRIIPVFLLCMWASAAADPNPATMIQLYHAGESLEQQLKTLEEIAGYTHDLYKEFASDLVFKLATRFDREPYSGQPYFTEQILLLSLAEVRKYDLTEAGQWVELIRIRTGSSRIIREAIFTLGEIQAVKFAPKLADTLHRYNQFAGQGNSALESEALACMLAIGKLGYTGAFPAMYDAWQGWYSNQVKSAALDILQNLTDDPTAFILELLPKADLTEFENLMAIQLQSAAPEESKQIVVREIFRREVEYSLKDHALAADLISARTRAMDALRVLNSKSPEDAPLCRELLITSTDNAEKSAAIKLLAANGSDEAIEALAAYLLTFKAREASGYEAADHSLIKLALNELGKTGSEKAVDALISIQTSSFPEAIRTLAAETLQAMQDR